MKFIISLVCLVLLCGFGSTQMTNECKQKFATFDMNEEQKVVVDLKKVLEKEFLAAPGALEEKLDLYKIICDKLTKKSDEVSQKINDNLLECFDADTKANLLFQQDITLHYNHYVCNIDQEAYSAMISPANIHKVEIKMAELDNCFKLAYTKSGESHFCGYDIPKALSCAKKFFPNDHQKTLAGIKSVANFMTGEFHCSTPEDPINKSVETTIDTIIEYVTPSQGDKPHFFMDVFLVFAKSFSI